MSELRDRALMQKQAIFPGLGVAIGHIAQNTLGRKIAKSKGYKKGLTDSFVIGALGKKAPTSVKGTIKDVASSLVAPERNVIRNEMYERGQSIAKKVKDMPKRHKVIARLAAAGDTAGLKRIGKHNHPVAKAVTDHLPRDMRVSKESTKKFSKLKDGVKTPANMKHGLAANVAIAPIMPDLAALNASKLAMNTKTVSKNKYYKKFTDWAVTQPIKDQAKHGATGKSFSRKINNLKSIALNPFTSEMERDAFRAGASGASKKGLGSNPYGYKFK